MRSAKEEHRHAGCESTPLETAGGRYNNTNKNSPKKKNRETEARMGAIEASVRSSTGMQLGKRVHELQTEKAKIASGFLAQHPSGNRRRLVGNQARGRGGRRGNGQLNNLFGLKDMRGSDTGTGRANIESLGELNKIDSEGISAAKKDGDLNANARVLTLVGGDHRFGCL
jgi:hypothetical protein